METRIRRSARAAFLALAAFALASPALAQEEEVKLAPQDWTFTGILGQYEPAQLKRGFQVYREVCSACHAMKLLAYRNLAEIGLSDDEIKAAAAEKQVTDGPNDQGDMFQRPARPSDQFVSPFPNDQAARAANNGALPPDLSLIVKARHGGPDYVYAILTGFVDAPKDFKLPQGMYYNTAFPGHAIGMPPPLTADRVTYADGTKATLEQEAHDAVTFLNWAAEPELNVRHNLGLKVLIFTIVLTALFYGLKRSVWSDVHH